MSYKARVYKNKYLVLGTWYLVLGLILSVDSHAKNSDREVSFGLGLGIFKSADTFVDQVKIINFEYRKFFMPGFYWSLRAGFWNDQSSGENRNPSGYFSGSAGIKVNTQPIVARCGLGVSAITSPDSYLGGRFPMFNLELFLGLEDGYGNGIGLKYEHISSAGLVMPNLGRDFLLVQLNTNLSLFEGDN